MKQLNKESNYTLLQFLTLHCQNLVWKRRSPQQEESWETKAGHTTYEAEEGTT